jgi:hypothetical protein
MAPKKIDLAKLDELIKAGKSPKEIAEFFQCSEVAIWKARKKLGLAIASTLTPEATNKIIESDLDLMARMRKLTQVVNEQLKEAEKDILNATGPEKRAIQEVLIKVASEGRKQVETILHIGQIWYTHRAYADFLEETSDYLDRISPGAKQRILEGLQERQALRSSLPLRTKEEKRYGSKTAK